MTFYSKLLIWNKLFDAILESPFGALTNAYVCVLTFADYSAVDITANTLLEACKHVKIIMSVLREDVGRFIRYCSYILIFLFFLSLFWYPLFRCPFIWCWNASRAWGLNWFSLSYIISLSDFLKRPQLNYSRTIYLLYV